MALLFLVMLSIDLDLTSKGNLFYLRQNNIKLSDDMDHFSGSLFPECGMYPKTCCS